jgi:hypothetical protein
MIILMEIKPITLYAKPIPLTAGTGYLYDPEVCMEEITVDLFPARLGSDYAISRAGYLALAEIRKHRPVAIF